MQLTDKQTTTVRSLRILYPFWMLFGIFSIIYIPSTLIDLADPIATLGNIKENVLLFRLGIAGRLVVQLLFIIIPFLFYQLFKNLDKRTALLLLVLALISVPMAMGFETINLSILGYLDDADKVMEMVLLYHQAMHIPVIFWGLWLLPLGWLVYKSPWFPKIIGVFLFIGGSGYLINAFLKIILPNFDQLDMVWEVMTFGEVLFILWFVIRGVRKPK